MATIMTKKRTKRCTGLVWQYKNTPIKGVPRLTWAAEAMKMGGGLLVCAYGYKRMKGAIAAANKALALLGWELVGSWAKETRPAVEDRAKRKKMHQEIRQERRAR